MTDEKLRANLRREMERMFKWLDENKSKKVDGVEIDQTYRQHYQRAIGYLDALTEVEGGRYD